MGPEALAYFLCPVRFIYCGALSLAHVLAFYLLQSKADRIKTLELIFFLVVAYSASMPYCFT